MPKLSNLDHMLARASPSYSGVESSVRMNHKLGDSSFQPKQEIPTGSELTLVNKDSGVVSVARGELNNGNDPSGNLLLSQDAVLQTDVAPTSFTI